MSDLQCLDMQKHPQLYLALLTQLHTAQEHMLTLIMLISEQCIPQQLHRREYQMKFPDELLHDNFSTHMLFAAEDLSWALSYSPGWHDDRTNLDCNKRFVPFRHVKLLVSGTYIELDETDGIMLSPLAAEVLDSLEDLRTVLREQSLTDPSTYTDQIQKALIQFDSLSAEFELRYVSLVVSVKTPEEMFKQQEIVVLFCETIASRPQLILLVSVRSGLHPGQSEGPQPFVTTTDGVTLSHTRKASSNNPDAGLQKMSQSTVLGFEVGRLEVPAEPIPLSRSLVPCWCQALQKPPPAAGYPLPASSRPCEPGLSMRPSMELAAGGALKLGYLTQDMIDVCEPQLMFTIPRLSIISGLLIYPDGPLNLQRRPEDMSKLFSPFYHLLRKIRDLLFVLSEEELTALEKSLCSPESDDHHLELSCLDEPQPVASSPPYIPADPTGAEQPQFNLYQPHPAISDLAVTPKPQNCGQPVAISHAMQELGELDSPTQQGHTEILYTGTLQHTAAVECRHVLPSSSVGAHSHDETPTPKTVIQASTLGGLQRNEGACFLHREWESMRPYETLQCAPSYQKEEEERTSSVPLRTPGPLHREWLVQTTTAQVHPGDPRKAMDTVCQKASQVVGFPVHHNPQVIDRDVPQETVSFAQDGPPLASVNINPNPKDQGHTQEFLTQSDFDRGSFSAYSIPSQSLNSSKQSASVVYPQPQQSDAVPHNARHRLHCVFPQNSVSPLQNVLAQVSASLMSQSVPDSLASVMHHGGPPVSVSTVHPGIPQVSTSSMHPAFTQDSAFSVCPTVPRSTASPMHIGGLLVSPSPGMPLDSAAMHSGVSEISVSSKHEGLSKNSASTMHQGESPDSASTMHQGESLDSASTMHQGESLDSASTMHQGESLDSASTMHQGESLDSASTMHQGESPDSASTMHQGESPDSASTMHQGESPDSASTMHQGESPDSASTMHQGESPDSASTMHQGESPDSASTMHQGESPDSASTMHQGESPDSASTMHQGESPDSASTMHQGGSPDAASRLHQGGSPVAASRLHQGESPDAASRLHQGESPDAASRLRQGESPDAASRLRQGESPDAASRLRQGEPPDAASRLHQGEPPDAASRLHQGESPDAASRLHQGESPDAASRLHQGESPDAASRLHQGLPSICASQTKKDATFSVSARHREVPKIATCTAYNAGSHGVDFKTLQTVHQDSVSSMQQSVPGEPVGQVSFGISPEFTSQIAHHRDLQVYDYPTERVSRQDSAATLHQEGHPLFASPVQRRFSHRSASLLHSRELEENSSSLRLCRWPPVEAAGSSLDPGTPEHPQTLPWIQDSWMIRSRLDGSSLVQGRKHAASVNSVFQTKDVVGSHVDRDAAQEPVRRRVPQPPIASQLHRHKGENSRHLQEPRRRRLRDTREEMSVEIRSRYPSTSDMLHRLFVCIAGVADQLQTNFASDHRAILKTVFEMTASKGETAEAPHADKEAGTASHRPEKSVQKHLEDCAQCLNENLHTTGHAESDLSLHEPPDWLPDSASNSCMGCRAAFTLVRRRHHCRSCGKIFCSRCSSNMVPLPHIGHFKPVRVCSHCLSTHLTPRDSQRL